MTAPPAAEALDFFCEVVAPTVAEFLAFPTDKRRGCLACLALASMVEHYFHARSDLAQGGEPALARLKGDLRRENATLGWMADVANATKHVQRGQRGNRIGYGDVEVLEMGRAGEMRAGWPIGGEEVVVGADREWLLRDLVEEAARFWRERLGVEMPV